MMNTSQQHTEIWEGSVQKQLWHLRYEDPTQYQALVKMHLSFATDMPIDECDGRSLKQASSRKWQLTPLIRRLGRTSVSAKGVMEGAPLTQEGVCQAFQLIHFLNKEYNISQEGIFRKSGSLTRQQELKNLLNSGGDLNLDSGAYSAHDCASVLKSFLADLPEPLLTEAHYSIHCKIAEMLQAHMCQKQKDVVYNRQIKALRLLFLLLPPENYQLLQDLLILLQRVASHQEQNLMSALNLGTMFAPHILCPRKMTGSDLQYLSGTLSTAVAFMIENAHHLFQIPLELEYDILQYWNNKKKLKHQLSKRSLMDAPTNTIFTFIDRELTAQANDKDVTEVALAELYAYVQSLPDSAKKRRLIKKFNHASGFGTPQLNSSNTSKKQESQGKRLGDSIKKHLFYKNIKSSKTKSTPISSFVSSVGVKRTNSDDLLNSPSKRSPELRRFCRNVDGSSCDQLRTKSLDDISSLNSGYSSLGITVSDASSYSSIIHPAFNPNSGYQLKAKNQLPGGMPQRHKSDSSSVSDSESNGSLASLPLTPLAFNSTYEAQGFRSQFDKLLHSTDDSCCTKELLPSFTFHDSVLDESKENSVPVSSTMMHSTPAGSSQMEVHSPISEAMWRSSIPQKVIMTPRSRCPIIVNSSTNLANTTIPEERETSYCDTTLEIGMTSGSNNSRFDKSSPIISNPSALLFSPAHPKRLVSSDSQVNKDAEETILEDKISEGKEKLDCEESSNIKKKLKKSSSFRRTLSSISSTGSLFGSFFHHLSSSSLGQLATRLTSSTSEAMDLSENEEEEEGENPPDVTLCNEKEMNESLSSVFREYLLSRSILTDNPVDLSVQYVDSQETKDDVINQCKLSEERRVRVNDHDNNITVHHDQVYPSDSNISQLCSTPSHLLSGNSAAELNSNASLTDSLLYCLDGNNPMSPINNIEQTAAEKNRETEYSEFSVIEQDLSDAACIGLLSCTPESRKQSILTTKQGTPLPQRDKEGANTLSSGKGIIFETSF